MKSPLMARTLSICAVALAILVPILAIQGKVGERRARAASVAAEFARDTSGAQSVAGPLLMVTCVDAAPDARPCAPAYFVPQSLDVKAATHVERLHRGIYPIAFFHGQLAIHARFEWPTPAAPPAEHGARWDQVYAVFLVSDPRGIKSFADAEGTALDATSLDGFTLAVPLGAHSARAPGSPWEAAYALDLVGTGSLQVAPLGRHNDIRVEGDWPHPSFGAAWAPDERTVTAQGFAATWRVSALATRGRADWKLAAAQHALEKAPGVSVVLAEPVNLYALSYRATEYAFLFVLFTFAALALTEILAGLRLHPVQYALVGSAIAVFFLLLIALSEHIGFSPAFALAAASCVALLMVYLRHPLGSATRTAAFGALFALMYGLLYGVLMSEDDALLLGSLLVFALLAAAMITTRRVDWTALSARLSREVTREGGAAS